MSSTRRRHAQAFAANVSSPSASMSDHTQVDDALSQASDELLESIRELQGDILILGAGGKMGPTFARMARRAFNETGKPSKVIAVSRFTDQSLICDLSAKRIE